MSPSDNIERAVELEFETCDPWVKTFNALRKKHAPEDWGRLIRDGCEFAVLTLAFYIATLPRSRSGNQRMKDLLKLANEIERLLLQKSDLDVAFIWASLQYGAGRGLSELKNSLRELCSAIRELVSDGKEYARRQNRSNSIEKFMWVTAYVNGVTGQPHHAQVSHLICLAARKTIADDGFRCSGDIEEDDSRMIIYGKSVNRPFAQNVMASRDLKKLLHDGKFTEVINKLFLAPEVGADGAESEDTKGADGTRRFVCFRIVRGCSLAIRIYLNWLVGDSFVPYGLEMNHGQIFVVS